MSKAKLLMQAFNSISPQCDHDVSGKPAGSMCACAAILKLAVEARGAGQ